MKKILLLGSQHGNEVLGEELYKYIKTKRPELLQYVTYKVANQRAKKANVRYIDADMNRSYDGGSKTYEQRQAKQVLKYIEANSFDLVLDLHTCFSVMPACLILPQDFKGVLQFVRSSSLDKIMIVANDVVKTSLIGRCPNAVAIEVNRDDLNQTFLDILCCDLLRYIEGEPKVAIKTVYKAEPLAKSEIAPNEVGKLTNFVKSMHGFYPILVGTGSHPYHSMASYKYLGFKAYTAERTKI